MSVLLIVLGLILTCAALFGWLWLFTGYGKGRARGAIALIALQISALGLIYGMLRGVPMLGVYLAVFPPLGVLEIIKAAPFWGFLQRVAWGVLPYGAGVLVLCLAVPRLRIWAGGLASATALVASVFVGDSVSQAAMCKAAAARGFDSFARNSFGWSLANVSGDMQFELHAVTEGRLAWSYREMDWYTLPERVKDYSSGEVFRCEGAV